MTIAKRIDSLAAWTENLPRWARPPVYGALFVAFLIGVRSGVIGIPVLLLVIALTSNHVARDLLLCVGFFGAALIGGALAGIAHAFAKRWIEPIPRVGRSLAGMVTVAPYMAVATAIVHVSGKDAWNAPIGGADVAAFVICTVLFGLMLAAE